MKKKAALALGIDCGGTNIKMALVKKSGEIVRSALAPMDFTEPPEKVIADMAGKIKKFIVQSKTSRPESLGMGIAGDVDQKKGIVRFSPNLNWKNVPLKNILSKELKIPVRIENDANCAAWGAYCLDAKKDCENLICLTLGTGVGGGIVIGGKLVRGATGSAGEIGHMTIEYQGRRCRCGNYGCLESLVGAWGLKQIAEEGLNKGLAPVLQKILKDKKADVTPKLLEEAAKAGDPFCKQLWMDAGERLGAALTNLVNIFNPERIVLCGGVSKAGSLILAPALHTMGTRAFETPARAVRVTISAYDEKLGVGGAALLFWE